jgi:putative ABC transport system permease protein
MFANYLKIAFRNLVKSKTYALINILGLAVGMASCALILLYVQHELSYDRQHEKAERIYRVTREWFNADGTTSLHLGHVAPPAAPLLANDFPEVLHAVRLSGQGRALLRFGEKSFRERFFAADSEVFQVFTFPFLAGNPETALNEPNSIVISETAARKFFGKAEALGKILVLPTGDGVDLDLEITGVMRDIPENSHFHFDVAGSMRGLEMFRGEEEFRDWGSNNYGTYLLFEEGCDVGRFVAEEIPAFLERHLGEDATTWNMLHLQKLTDIHLHSRLDSEFEANGNITHVFVLSAIAFFVLLIACINFMNLSTARSSTRAREVGVRKAVGAGRFQLIQQFLGESVLLASIALLLAMVLVELVLPSFSRFVGVELDFAPTENAGAFLGFVAIGLFVGVVAGGYPAFFLSSFQPAAVLKAGQRTGTGGSLLRRGLVIFQFVVTIALFIGVGVVRGQLDYCRSKDLGIDAERIVVFPSAGEMIEGYDFFRHRLMQHPAIVGVAASKRVPSAGLLDNSGARVFDGEDVRQLDFRVANVRVSHDFIDTYGIELAAGRNFSVEFPTDATEAFVLNEAAVRKIGWPSAAAAVGKSFGYGDRRGQIIGVVEDFHYESFHKPIAPIVMLVIPDSFNNISVKIQSESGAEMGAALGFLEEIWREYRPEEPFDYSFLDERYERLYRAERNLGQLFGIFALLAISIACLGLFGLATFMAERRTKEIGIRKTLGASMMSIVLLLSGDSTRWVLLANLAAWPMAYFAMDRWLENFAYRVDLDWAIFALAGGAALAIAWLTVSYQAVRAALSNPIEALRYE